MFLGRNMHLNEDLSGNIQKTLQTDIGHNVTDICIEPDEPTIHSLAVVYTA